MGRTVRDTNLGTITARKQLAPRGKPYWRALEGGFHMGYRRGKEGGGSWVVRRFVGDGKYLETKLGTADDLQDADGVSIQSYSQAQEAARAWWKAAKRVDQGIAPDTGPYLVADALRDYFAAREHEGSKGVAGDRQTAQARILPQLGAVEVEKLTTIKIRSWLDALAKSDLMVRKKMADPRQASRTFDANDTEAVRARRSTANRILTVLKAELNHAFTHDRAVSDAAWRKVKPFREADAAIVRYLTAPEWQRLINSCERDFRDLVRGALLSGCRYGFPKRVAGLNKVRGINGDVDFHTIYTAPNLGAMDGDLDALIAAIEAAGVKPGFIVVDTTAKTIGAAEENGAGMAAFVWNAGALAEHFGCFVLAVHHVGHGEDAQKRPRGWSGVIGAGDTLILCEREGEGFETTITVQKEKDEASGFSLTAHLSRVVLGHDKDGDEISTLVVDDVVKAEAVAKRTPTPKSVPASQRLLMDCVNRAVDEAGEAFHPWADSPEVHGVADHHIRARLYAAIAEQAGPDEEADKLEERQRKAFNRSIEAAIKAKRLAAKDHKGVRYIWLP